MVRAVRMEVGRGTPRYLGPYLLLQPLGAGGMGEVHLALSPGSRLVAVKAIRPEYAEDSTFRRRFRQEVEAARRVSGFFTPPVLDADTEAAVPWLATVYVPAPTLHEVVRRSGRLTSAGVRALGAGLAEALISIHAAGLVHRDLKPANVLVTADGARVIDFGISRALDAVALTRTTSTVGTPGYMAPEQIRPQPDDGAGTRVSADPAVDVFALGCVLAFAGTGTGPFGEGDTAEQLHRTLVEDPNLTGMPPELMELVSACLDKEPAYRPAPATILEALTPCDPATMVTSVVAVELGARARHAATAASRDYTPPRPGQQYVPTTTVLPPHSRRQLLAAGAAVLGIGAAAGLGAAVVSRSKGPATTKADTPLSKAAANARGVVVPATDSAAVGAPLWSASGAGLPGHDPGPGLTAPGLQIAGQALVWWSSTWAMAFDRAGGRPRWRRPETATDPIQSYQGVYDSLLFGLARTGLDALALDSAGNVAATVPVEDVRRAVGAAAGQVTAVGAAAGTGLFTAGDTLMAVDLTATSARWSRRLNQPFQGQDAIGSGHLSTSVGLAVGVGRCYLGDAGVLYALDPGTGAELWRSPRFADMVSGLILAADALYTIGAGVLHAVDAATGRERWSAQLPANTAITGLAAAAGRVFVADDQNNVQAYEAASGKGLWYAQAPRPDVQGTLNPASGNLSAAQDLLAVPLRGENSGVIVMDAVSGRTLWTYQSPTAEGVWSVLAADSTVYAASASTLHAFPGRP